MAPAPRLPTGSSSSSRRFGVPGLPSLAFNLLFWQRFCQSNGCRGRLARTKGAERTCRGLRKATLRCRGDEEPPLRSGLFRWNKNFPKLLLTCVRDQTPSPEPPTQDPGPKLGPLRGGTGCGVGIWLQNQLGAEAGGETWLQNRLIPTARGVKNSSGGGNPGSLLWGGSRIDPPGPGIELPVQKRGGWSRDRGFKPDPNLGGGVNRLSPSSVLSTGGGGSGPQIGAGGKSCSGGSETPQQRRGKSPGRGSRLRTGKTPSPCGGVGGSTSGPSHSPPLPRGENGSGWRPKTGKKCKK